MTPQDPRHTSPHAPPFTRTVAPVLTALAVALASARVLTLAGCASTQGIAPAAQKIDPATLGLPSAPKQFLHYFEEPDRPQARLDRDCENGMGVTIGRLREDSQYDYKFVSLAHNTMRGAAGGGVLLAEMLAAEGYFDR